MAACAVPMVPLIAFTLFNAPLALPLGLLPMLIVAPVLLWLDRVEPEPWSSKIHAFLWGGLVATLIGLVCNTTTASLINDSVAAVVSAPVSEELMKGLGILWAVRRAEVHDVMDGIVYAGWVALGFAVAEDFFYLVTADQDGALVAVAIGRTVLTPFAHPLFTAWTGLAIGLAIRKGKNPWVHALWGLALAIATHAAWNGSLVGLQDRPGLLVVVLLLFVLLFVSAAIACYKMHTAERRRFVAAAPALAHQFGLAPNEVNVFATWSSLRSARKSLDRPRRRAFDALHGSLSRLASLQARGGSPDSAEARVYGDQLRSALDRLR